MLSISDRRLADEGVLAIDVEGASMIAESNDAMAVSGMRVLAMAYKDIDKLPAKAGADIESGMVFIGLTGMQDPARAETAPAVEECHKAGITPVMITGDHLKTAVAIARQVGIADQDSLSLSGADLAKLSDAELANTVENIRVYARVDLPVPLGPMIACTSPGWTLRLIPLSDSSTALMYFQE